MTSGAADLVSAIAFTQSATSQLRSVDPRARVDVVIVIERVQNFLS